MLQEAADQYNIDLPTLERIIAEQLGPSAQEGVRGQLDPRLRQEQMASLNSLGEVAAGGHNADTDAAMNRILSQVGRQESAGRNAILGNMRARGVSGSGAELASQLSNNQAAAERSQDAGLQQGAAAQKRMLDAIAAKGQMAGSMRSQDYGELSDAARAKDAISRYNHGSREKAQYYNAGLGQQQFGNKLQLAQGKANALTKQGNAASAGGNAAANTWAGAGQAFQTGATAVGQGIKDWQDDEEKP
jgi:hypothetical protein